MRTGSASTPPNILVILTDQQRQFRHWPQGWAEQHLRSFQRLAKTGLTFERAFTNTCMCSPSRATLWTSLFPAQTGVQSTGSQPLGTGFTTLAQVMTSAGYQVGYRGKWHLGDSSDDMPTALGFGPWDPPDAGTSLSPGNTQGAGAYNNDARYLGTVAGSSEKPTGTGPSMIDFLRTVDPSKPFCLVASFVNPHDVYVAPFQYGPAGYDPKDWEDLPIQPPASWNEDLSTKPSVQAWFQGSGKNWNVPQWSDADRTSYARFYAYLQMLVDRDIMTLLDTLESCGFTENTVIFRLADHGEMAMSHGLVEKTFNAYDETVNVPLIVSNPGLFPTPLVTKELAGHIDLLPTLASVAGVLDKYTGQFKGIDLSPLFTAPDAPRQESIHFTFDDVALAQGMPATTPGHIRALRSKDWLYAAYFTETGSAFEYELYDLTQDPDELTNLAAPRNITPDSRKQLVKMNHDLIRKMQASGTTPSGFAWPTEPAV
ncbi:sulfatase-like hydrolase/transferase [Pyxidicoccus sp. MSG2]|uniref:sulfatase-like hydrolase/transferase n=1 Tax=Pyxidicoccus sp. MSG2 TaxID=2996790 RepID=UPI00226FB624|nr:sulfatase-like hydrolase/transferase [Pyxidicoccus sp. MSG2]MCY1023403.1 sulfatase-like hydrolase/transferase [Pyxidicoccus sp. MSG2]